MSSIMRQTLVVLRKDLVLEWRHRARVISVLVFGIVTLVLFSFATGPNSAQLQAGMAGFLTLALLLSSTLALSESFRVERDSEGIEGLLLLPIEPSAVFYGKAIGNTLFLTSLAPVLIPIAVVLYGAEIPPVRLLVLLALWALASAGLAAPGTLYSAMTSRVSSRDVLLPVMLFPLVTPVLLGSVKAMAYVLNGDPMGQLRSWTVLLGSFALIYWTLCGVLFPYAIEDTS